MKQYNYLFLIFLAVISSQVKADSYGSLSNLVSEKKTLSKEEAGGRLVIPSDNLDRRLKQKVSPEVNGRILAKVADVAMINGYWEGGIPMGDHEHKLGLTFTVNQFGNVDLEYRFQSMQIRPFENTQKVSNYVNLNEGIQFSIPKEGISFTGILNEEGSIEGQIEWIGLRQKIVLEKITSLKSFNSNNKRSINEKTNIGILLFDGVDVLDWAGPLEAFVMAHSFNTFTIAPEMKAYDGGEYKVLPKYTFDDAPEVDILIVPGGDTAPIMHNERIVSWIKEISSQAQITMSVCNGATILAGAELLNGLEATTHHSWKNWLSDLGKQNGFTVVDNKRFVDNGKVITTAGVSSGIDGALHIIAKLKGLKRARLAARMMEYNWTPSQVEQYKN